MRKFLIGAAAVALAASGALADPGGKGGGKDGDGGGKGNDRAQAGPAHAGHGGGQDSRKAERAPGNGKAAKADRGPQQAKADRGQPAQAKTERGASQRQAEPDGRPSVREAKADRGEKRHDRALEVRDVRDVRSAERDMRGDRRSGDLRTVSFGDERRGLFDGCPPGLARKNNGCLPPGLAKRRDGDFREAFYQPSWFGYDRVGDGRYFYDDGYLYRLGSNDSVLGYIPLLGGALSVGNPWPSYYEPYEAPEYYQEYYNLGPANSYRYADDVLYRVDPQSGMINSIAALLTGDQFAVGQPMPTGYDVYNVPPAYQDQYYDTPDAAYRYADGYVYEVDPTTQLVQAVIELLV